MQTLRIARDRTIRRVVTAAERAAAEEVAAEEVALVLALLRALTVVVQPVALAAPPLVSAVTSKN